MSCNAQVSHTVMFGDVVCCLQGQSSFAELMNGNRKAKRRKQSGLTEIRSDMEEVSKGQKFVIFFLFPNKERHQMRLSGDRFRTSKRNHFLSS